MNWIDHKKSDLDVHLRANASEAERFAARELCRYVRKTTGTRLRVETCRRLGAGTGRILLAQAEAPEKLTGLRKAEAETLARLRALRSGSFILKRTGRHILIAGRDAHGLVIGTYAFIEKILGVRFVAPGPEGEYIPRHRAVKIGALEVTEEPAFACRTTYNRPVGAPDAMEFLDWSVKNRVNFLQPVPQDWDSVRDTMRSEFVRKRGMKVLMGGHISDHFFPPADPYFKTHPEYFGLCRGQRAPGQICYSNRQALKIFMDNVVAYLEAHPEIDIFAPWPNDGSTDDFCACAVCRSKPLDILLLEVAQMLTERIHRFRPELVVLHLCYTPGAGKGPPPGIRPMPNFVPLYCPYSDKSKFFPVFHYRHGRHGQQLGQNNASICADLLAWRQTHEVMLFTYYNDQILKQQMYTPHPDVIRDELKYFQSIGVSGLWDCLCLDELTGWMDAVNLYAFTRGAWNPDADFDGVLREFYPAYYDQAGPDMMVLDRAVGAFMRMPLYQGCVVEDVAFFFYDDAWLDTFRPALAAADFARARHRLETLALLADNAARAARKSPIKFRRRIARVRCGIDTLRRQFELSFQLFMVAGWLRRAAKTEDPGRRRAGVKEAGHAWAEARPLVHAHTAAYERWNTLKPEVPGLKYLRRRSLEIPKVFDHYGKEIQRVQRQELAEMEGSTMREGASGRTDAAISMRLKRKRKP